MTKAEAIEALEKDYARAQSMRNQQATGNAEDAIAVTMYYEGQMIALKMAMLLLGYLDEV